MSQATTTEFSSLLDPSFRKAYLDSRTERPLEYTTIFNVQTMEIQNEKDLELAGLGAMPQKEEGVQFTLDKPMVGGNKQYTAVAYGLAAEVTFEMWDDDLFGEMRRMAQELGRSSRNRIEVDAATILNNAFDTGVTGFDNTSLCSTSHTDIDGTTRANRPSTDISFSISGLQAGIQAYETMVNQRGMPMLMTPTMVVIDPNNRFTAREILGSAGKPFTADNELNSLLADDLRYFVYHYLTTNTYWFLMAPKGVHDLNFRWRNRPMMNSFDDPRTMNAVFTLYQRHAKGWGQWRGVYGSTG